MKKTKTGEPLSAVLVAIDSLTPNEKNPRVLKEYRFRKLVDSVKRAPWMLNIRPIVADKEGVILGGNMRWQACKAAGMKEVPVIYVEDLTEEQKVEFTFRDNVSAGEWDWEVLGNEFDTTFLQEVGLDVFVAPEPEQKLSLTDEEKDSDNIAQVEVPKITDAGFVRLEVVMKIEQRDEVIKKANRVKNDFGITLGDALYKIVNSSTY